MSIFRPELNPIRFAKSGNYDYLTQFPVIDNLRTFESLKDSLAVPVRQSWGLNIPIEFQIQWTTGTNTVKVYSVLNGVESELTAVDVTPVGFLFDYEFVMSYSFTPNAVGQLYFKILEDEIVKQWYYSDILEVKLELNGCVLIEYTNDNNGNGVVWNNNISYFLTQKLFLTGQMKTPIAKSESSSYKDSQGNFQKLTSIPSKGRRLQIFDISDAMYMKLVQIFSCSTILINGISYQIESDIELTEKSNSNNYDASVDLFMTNWNRGYDDNYTNYQLNLVLVDGNGEFFEDGNSEVFTL